MVDLNRWQSHARCIFAAPTVFRMQGEESLDYDYNPDDAVRERVQRAAAACPVQAIYIDRADPRLER